MSDDPFEYVTPPLKIVRDMVAIPRAQYEALIAAAKALKHITSLSYGYQGRTVAKEALAALRSAGIQTGDRPNE